MLTIVLFIIILSLVVLIHEGGHFIAARRFGVAVEEFGFGFPPRLIGFARKGTVYSLNWIPFGGFVRLKGEGNTAAQESDAFPAQPAWKRFIILASGVAMNALLAAVLFTLVLALGLPTTRETIAPGGTIRDERVRVVRVEENSPAAAAGLREGDTLLELDGKTIRTVADVQDAQRDKADQTLSVLVGRDRERQTLSVTPTRPTPEEAPRMGVRLAETAVVSYPFFRALWLGVRMTAELSWQIIAALAILVRDLIVTQTVRGDLVGPIGVAVLTGQVAKLGFVPLLQFTALLSLSLAVLNFTPFPALDGGRALFVAIEKVRGKTMNPRTENLIHNLGFYFLVGLIILISIRDLNAFGIVETVKRLLP